MNRKFNEEIAEAVDTILVEHFGSLVNDQIADMMDFSDMTDVQQLAVIDGAIALGAWVSAPNDIEQLRQWRAELVERMDADDTWGIGAREA